MRPLPQKKSQLSLLVAILAGVIIVMFLLRQCSRSRATYAGDTPGSNDTINVAIDYSPMSLYTYDDTLGGFNYDLINALARENNLKIKFHPIVSIGKAVELLDSGVYDIVVADLPMTSDYKDRYLFTDPVYYDRQILVQRRDSNGRRVATQLDLAGRTVTTIAGSPMVSRVANLSAEIGDTIYVAEDSVYGAEQLMMLTAAGEIDLAVINEGIARAMIKDYPDLDISTNVSFTQFQSWMLPRSNAALRDSVNSMLDRFKQSPRYQSLLDRYHLFGR